MRIKIGETVRIYNHAEPDYNNLEGVVLQMEYNTRLEQWYILVQVAEYGHPFWCIEDEVVVL